MQRCKGEREMGLSEEKIQAIRSGSVASYYSPIERAALAYTDCLLLEGGRAPAGVFEALQEGRNAEETLELTYLTCAYEMRATLGRAPWASRFDAFREGPPVDMPVGPRLRLQGSRRPASRARIAAISIRQLAVGLPGLEAGGGGMSKCRFSWLRRSTSLGDERRAAGACP